ncbi:MAG: sulfotransferase [Polyangiales bacterium]|nr:sulfotransferase [Myxococcales bacterium]
MTRSPYDAPIFVVGNRRSGTTMLRLMLASHPRIGIPPEAGFAVVLGWKYGRVWFRDVANLEPFLDDYFALDNAKDWELSRGDLHKALELALPCSFPTIVERIYRAYLARKFPGKPRWGDKTTGLQEHAAELAAYFPHAQFVHIVRDGRAVAASYKGVHHLAASGIESVAREWRATLATLEDLGRSLGHHRYHVLRYEDLVQYPGPTLEALCAFLGEDYAPTMLEFGAHNRNATLEPARHLGWKGKTLEAIDPSEVGRWRDELAPREVRTFERIAGDALSAFGYALETRDPWRLGQVRFLPGTLRYEFAHFARRHARMLRYRVRRGADGPGAP